MSEEKERTANWTQYIITSLLGIIMFLVGGAWTERQGSEALKLTKETLDTHQKLAGHPVLVERVSSMDEKLNAIIVKLDDLIIYQIENPKK